MASPIDFTTRYISTISLGLVVGLSVFNLGYFWKIGLHFIGLIDLTNIVYSAGLAVASIVVWLQIAAFIYPKKPATWVVILYTVVGTALVAWGVWTHDTRSFEPALLQHAATLLGFAIAGSALLAWTIERQRSLGYWGRREVAVLLFTACATLFEAGGLTAGLELTDRIVYSVSTKSGVLSNVRILRSSSAGFLLAAEGRVMFVPQGEIKDIKSALAAEIPYPRP